MPIKPPREGARWGNDPDPMPPTPKAPRESSVDYLRKHGRIVWENPAVGLVVELGSRGAYEWHFVSMIDNQDRSYAYNASHLRTWIEYFSKKLKGQWKSDLQTKFYSLHPIFWFGQHREVLREAKADEHASLQSAQDSLAKYRNGLEAFHSVPNALVVLSLTNEDCGVLTQDGNYWTATF